MLILLRYRRSTLSRTRMLLICYYWYLWVEYPQHSDNIAITSAANIVAMYDRLVRLDIENILPLLLLYLRSTYCQYRFNIGSNIVSMYNIYNLSILIFVSSISAKYCQLRYNISGRYWLVDTLPILTECWIYGRYRQCCIDVVSTLGIFTESCRYRAYEVSTLKLLIFII